MIHLVTALLLLAGKQAPGKLELNGERIDVSWSDGDSFKVKSGKFKGSGTRLQGYNTLEKFGPVHKWGGWSPEELFQLALDAGPKAASQDWVCSTDGNKDGYGRLLILCPELTRFMVLEGYAMAYSVEGTPDPELIALQQKAIANKAGIWKKGAPRGIITSLHSVDEDGGKAGVTYNRVVDTKTGAALKREHKNKYESCQEVCETTEGDISCMIYVPFENRYKNKPSCLR